MSTFLRRHVGSNEAEQKAMLQTIGVASINELIEKTIPAHIRLKGELDINKAMSEQEYLSHMAELASKNRVFKSYIGLGYNETIVPSVILRNVLENPGWYTAYTPYQAEIAQGRLEALINYQTMVMDLTGMEMANASLLDEATAAAEAMTMLYASKPKEKKNAHTYFVDEKIFMEKLKQKGIAISSMGHGKLRIVTHLDYKEVMHEYVMEAFSKLTF